MNAMLRGPRRPGVRRDVPHYVYRCYDASGALLYVGCSNAPVLRVQGHRESSWWGSRIETVRHTVFPDRAKALSVERRAIFAERPACNVKGRWYRLDPRDDWAVEDYHVLHTAVVSAARGHVGTSTTRLLSDIEAEMAARFNVTPLLKWKAAA